MIYLGLPFGGNIGRGVLGKQIAFALEKLTEVRVLAPTQYQQQLVDEFERFHMRQLLTVPERHGQQVAGAWQLDGPVIQGLMGNSYLPFVTGLVPPAELGFGVFEDNILSKKDVECLRNSYCRIAAGSTYCAEVLREHGLHDISVLPHGVDTTLFCPRLEKRSLLADRFVIFSGGKFELRKGQDIVIRAYKVMQDRHPDVMLVNAWHNAWPKSRDTMAESTLIRYAPPANNDIGGWMNHLLAAHGIDVNRVITVGPRDPRLLPDLYHATDLGLFPNRVEGGNNMVLMEYLACGKPALVSYNSGHRDIVRRQNAVLIEGHRPMHRRREGVMKAIWNDPSVEETIDKLEWCYQHREQLAPLAHQAATDMRAFTWDCLASGLLNMAVSGETACG
jgi:glycosyltransferase involved in cell wall biosynthesis